MTVASIRKLSRSRSVALSLTVLIAHGMFASLPSFVTMPLYTIPNEPWPSSSNWIMCSRGTSHSSTL
uniref:Putative secreted peptide n=1 Tax=Anopheles braziliensis TaxID=58242 RepID=A0A2M3ZPZ3_9DIPT